MSKNSLKSILLISIVVWVIGLLLCSIMLIIDYSFLLGWCFGYLLSLSGYFLNILTSKWFFIKKRSRINGFWVGYARAMIQIIWYSLLIYFIVWIDVVANGHSLFTSGKLSDVFSPINIFSFIFGTSIMVMSIFIFAANMKIVNYIENKVLNG